MPQVIANIWNQNIIQQDDLSFSFMGECQIDADGSPRAYAPEGSGLKGLDLLANAGRPGNWFGIQVDAHGNPIIQGPGDPHPGYYVSTTSLCNLQQPGDPNPGHPWPESDPRRYVDSEKVAYIVIPGCLAKNCKGVVLGCLATVRDPRSGARVPGVVADTGPNNHLGEVSIMMASKVGVSNLSPINGGSDQRIFQYTVYPGQPAPGFTLQGMDGRFHPLPTQSGVMPDTTAVANAVVVSPEFGTDIIVPV